MVDMRKDGRPTISRYGYVRSSSKKNKVGEVDEGVEGDGIVRKCLCDDEVISLAVAN
jgi:hypothetical protein